MNIFTKFLLFLILPLVLAAATAVGSAYYWAHRPLDLPAERVDILVPLGSTPSSIARLMNQAGVSVNPQAFVVMARLGELDKTLKAGGYQIRRGDSAWVVLRRMALGDMTQRQITFVEGWNLKQIRAALSQHPDIKQTLENIGDSALINQLDGSVVEPLKNASGGLPSLAEGLFFPDTYIFPIGTPDIEILQRAARAQQMVLSRAWDARQQGLPLKSPYEALILASIIEKETGKSSDRARISGVFINRLRLNMPLQTDPTVIYGMGDSYAGKIRKQDLQTDTPWNTYTRNGLPPTPIAISGRAALNAALQPETHQYLYFVSKGDGNSAFSVNLTEHNKNVSTYILGRKP
ncbi:MAG: endolytic transglycosylase MltG [Sheuella sp.]|nr:endolytic transglycosylase MltG [Sheuella sp.]